MSVSIRKNASGFEFWLNGFRVKPEDVTDYIAELEKDRDKYRGYFEAGLGPVDLAEGSPDTAHLACFQPPTVTDEHLYAAYELGHEHGVEAEELRHLPCCATYIGDVKQLRAALQKGKD